MQTSFHIMALVPQLQKEIVGGQIVSTEFYKKERAAFIFVKMQKSTNALGFVYHPAGYGTFLVPASKIKIGTREKPWPFFDITGAAVVDVVQIGFDRIFKVILEKDGLKKHLMFESVGPNGNIWLLDTDDKKVATLRKRDFESGDIYLIPPLPDALNPLELTTQKLRQYLERDNRDSLLQRLRKVMLGGSKTIAGEIIKRAGLADSQPDELNDDLMSKLVKSVKNITSLFTGGDSGYLYQMRSGIEVYPFKLSSIEQQPEKFKSLSLATLAMTRRRQSSVEQADEEKTVRDAIAKAIRKLEKRIKNIQTDIEHATDYEQFKKHGELIQINMSGIKKGMEEITIDDIYSDSPDKVTIKLDSALSPAENAERYFRKYRKAREGLEQMNRRLEISLLELDKLQEIRNAVELNYQSAQNKYESELAELLPKVGAKTEGRVRLPYKEFELKSGVRIYVGREGTDNDRTTFEFAKPYELWFHTQQCPGSHVVLKFPNKSFEPSKREIEETASVAAYFSKARKDSLVPVIYTQRKYVRKPRKAKPGLVTVEREKSVMVVPTKPEG